MAISCGNGRFGPCHRSGWYARCLEDSRLESCGSQRRCPPAVILGLLSIVLPGAPGALSQAWGVLAATWGVLFAVAAEWEARLGMPSAG